MHHFDHLNPIVLHAPSPSSSIPLISSIVSSSLTPFLLLSPSQTSYTPTSFTPSAPVSPLNTTTASKKINSISTIFYHKMSIVLVSAVLIVPIVVIIIIVIVCVIRYINLCTFNQIMLNINV